MNIQPNYIFAKLRHPRKRRVVASQPAPPGALMLVSAWYDFGGPELTLVFDRAVNIDAYDGSQIVVNDQVHHALFDGLNGATLIGPASVLIGLSDVASSSGSQVLLSATGTTGIVAADDAQAWPGVTDLELPFP